MSRSLSQALFKLFMAACILLLGTQCRKPDNTNRIRPSSNTKSKDDYLPLFYNITKNGKPWPFPAISYMSAQTSKNGYGHYNHYIQIDNSYTRNDTLFYDDFTLKVDNIPPYNPITRIIGSSEGSTVAYYTTGHYFNSDDYYAPGTFNPNPTTTGYVEIISQDNLMTHLRFTVTPYQSRTTFQGEIQFLHEPW